MGNDFPILTPEALVRVRLRDGELPALVVDRLPITAQADGTRLRGSVSMEIGAPGTTLLPVLWLEVRFASGAKLRAGLTGTAAVAWLEETLRLKRVALMPEGWRGEHPLPVFGVGDVWRRIAREFAARSMEAYRRLFPPAAQN